MGLLGASLLGGCGSVKDTAPDALGGGDAGGDAPAIDAPGVDAAPAACGDGVRSPGEVCYGQALVFVANDVAFDGHLADQDGDGDLDLIYLIGDEYKFHLQNQGQFAATALSGPTTFGQYALSTNLGGSARLELIDAGGTALSTWGVGVGQNGYTALGQVSPGGTAELAVTGLALGHVTGGAIPNVVALYGNSVVVGTYNASLQLIASSQASPLNPRDLAVGRIDADAFADVVVAAQGVLVYRGTSNGLAQTTITPHTSPANAVAIGDLDADAIADIAFVVSGATGQLGAMRGVGGAAFLASTTQTVANLAPVLESADIDGDGRADVIGARTAPGSNAILVALGQADGTLATPVALPIATPAVYLRADADFNGDGIADLVATDIDSQTIVILPSNP